MKISYNWLKDYIKSLPKPEKLAEILTLHSFETNVSNQQSAISNQHDTTFDVDVLPNRAHDCLSHIGVAREIAAITKSKCQNPNYSKSSLKSKTQIKDLLMVKVESTELCPRYTARVITGVKVGSSPKWMQERLEAMGQKSINNIVDATNYIMFECGQPLHSFDVDKLTVGLDSQVLKSKFQNPNVKSNPKPKLQKEIIIRKAKRGEKITTLDGEKYDLDKNVLVIADSREPIAIAGVKGGKKAEIDGNTKNIILESANFDLLSVRKTSKNLGLRTESSIRFEHGIDPNLASEAIDGVASLIQEMAGGEIATGLIDVYPKKSYSKKIKLDIEYIKSLLGIEIPLRQVKKILENLGFSVAGVQPLQVSVPTYRLDIEIPEDLIEEVVRIYGYDKIPSKAPVMILIAPKKNEALHWKEMTKNILKALGLDEVYNYSLIGEKDLTSDTLHLTSSLENPISEDKKYLRPSLIPGALANIKENLKYFSEVRLFELGRTFKRNPKLQSPNPKAEVQNQKDSNIEEKAVLAGIISYKQEAKGELFYELKGKVDALLQGLGISDIWYDGVDARCQMSDVTLYHSRSISEIKIGQEEIGCLGEISAEVLDKYNIKLPVAVFEIDFEKLSKLASQEHEYQPVAKYPAIVRDIAILVSPFTRVVDVLNKINSVGGSIIRDIDLFDMYEGGGLPGGKKSLAFHIVFQLQNRSLTAKEVDDLMKKIIYLLEQDSGWEVRK